MSDYLREKKEDKPVVAICYDFDKTLSPDDMQAQGYIQSVGYDVDPFWRESNIIAKENDMDSNLAYMYQMMAKAHGNFVFNKKALMEYGSRVALYPGVESWFERIREFGKEHNIIVEHYIISSGLKEMIEGTSVAQSGAFKKIYACSFYYDDAGVAVWPAQVVNYTNKTQFLFRIEKGVLDVNDAGVNDFFAPEDLRIPFRNIIYIGDSDTDVPCMKLVNSYGGHSIGVYDPEKKEKTKVFKMLHENRIRYFAPADYSEGKDLEELVKAIIVRTEANEKLEEYHHAAMVESSGQAEIDKKEQERQDALILSLQDSSNFATTHAIISQLNEFSRWNEKQRELLYDTAVENSQVRLIINDEDVNSFYRKLISEEPAQRQKEIEAKIF